MANRTSAERRTAITEQPIASQLIRLTAPMLLALVSVMGLGVVDSYFVAFLGTVELAAIGFTAPVTAVITSVALGLGMAISSRTSRLIGENKSEQASRLISDGFLLTTVIAMLAVMALALTNNSIFAALGAKNDTLAFINGYMRIWLIGAPLIMLTQVASSTFRALGDTASAAKIAVVLTLLNMIFDPLFIFGFGPIPAMGVEGAAIATVAAVLIASGYALYRLYWVEAVLLLDRPRWAQLKTNLDSLIQIAVPAMLANAIVPIIATALTTVVAVLGTATVAGWGVAVRIELLMLMVVYALSSTLPMFIGQNLGAQKPDRVHQALTIAFRFVFVWQALLTLGAWAMADAITALFTDDPVVAQSIRLFLSIVPVSHGLAGAVILINVSMNVLGKPRWALYINLLRLCALTLPLALLGRHIAGFEGVLLGIALGHLLAFGIAILLLNRVLIEQGVPAIAFSRKHRIT